MKVCLALLIALLACLLVLASDVSGRRYVREGLQEMASNYALNHLREDMEFVGYFKETKLERSCDVCHELYGISKGDCMTVEHDASGLCFEKSARDRSHFKSKWHELVSEESPKASPADSERRLKLSSVEEYFNEEHLKRTCKVCADIGGVVNDDCIADKNDARKWCRITMEEMRQRFNAEWDKSPAK